MDEITYTITATNTGDGAKEIEISDEVPAGTTLKAGSITQNGTERDMLVSIDGGAAVEKKAAETMIYVSNFL